MNEATKERLQAERLASWSYDQLLASLNEAEARTEDHLDILSGLISPAGYSVYEVLNELLSAIKESKRKIGGGRAR